jgi:hypothetical protein
VWFTEKDRPDGSARLYQLFEFDPRNQGSIGRRYLSGRYGERGGTPLSAALQPPSNLCHRPSR